MSLLAANSRNQFHGRIQRIRRGPVVSEVEVETDAGLLCSVVTTSSLDVLGLATGERVVALFKATEVILGRFQSISNTDQ